MKKIIGIVCIIALVAGAGVMAYFGTEIDAWPKVKVASANLYSDHGYINYAEKVYFDVEKEPELADTGLFWARWNADENKIELLHADSPEGAALIDTDKPTIINVHGVLSEGNKYPELFNLNVKVHFPEDYGVEGENVSMLYLWLREGWNVGVFYYNKFVADVPNAIEGKIWSNNSPLGIKYRKKDGSESDPHFTKYCLAEHFAAEYIRAMRFLPKTMGDKEIRLTAHSMGGQLATAGLFLLTELARVGQLPHYQLPSRYALLDAYFSIKMPLGDGFLDVGIKDVNISWSGKPLYNNSVGKTMIECLKDLKANGIAVEYYVYESSVIKAFMADLSADLRDVCVYVSINPDYNSINSRYTLLGDGHNGVREWYLVSLLSPPIKDATEGSDSGELAPSAALDTAVLKSFMGKAFIISEGAYTTSCDDDVMVRRYSIFYELNGGSNISGNPDHYSKLSSTITLGSPKRKEYTFLGWYKNPDFSGTKVETIDPGEKQDIKLYAKWEAK